MYIMLLYPHGVHPKIQRFLQSPKWLEKNFIAVYDTPPRILLHSCWTPCTPQESLLTPYGLRVLLVGSLWAPSRLWVLQGVCKEYPHSLHQESIRSPSGVHQEATRGTPQGLWFMFNMYIVGILDTFVNTYLTMR